MLEVAPLGAGVSEQNLRPMLALSYVLVADTREFWDRDDLGPAQVAARNLAGSRCSMPAPGRRGRSPR